MTVVIVLSRWVEGREAATDALCVERKAAELLKGKPGLHPTETQVVHLNAPFRSLAELLAPDAATAGNPAAKPMVVVMSSKDVELGIAMTALKPLAEMDVSVFGLHATHFHAAKGLADAAAARFREGVKNKP